MSQTPQQQGTTLEVLQHYLTAGIEVYMPAFKHFLGGCVPLDSLRAPGPAYPEGFVYGRLPESPVSRIGHKPSVCLPVLRPFSQLCEPLPDETIPAVEVAKLVMQANRPEGCTPIASYGLPVLMQDGQVISVNCHRDTSYTLELLVDTTWAVCTVYDFGIVYAHNMLAVHDWLRANHFALPVNGRPLIEGVDYIAKKSVSGPTKEEGGKP